VCNFPMSPGGWQQGQVHHVLISLGPDHVMCPAADAVNCVAGRVAHVCHCKTLPCFTGKLDELCQLWWFRLFSFNLVARCEYCCSTISLLVWRWYMPCSLFSVWYLLLEHCARDIGYSIS
jgi:hypothetical protein